MLTLALKEIFKGYAAGVGGAPSTRNFVLHAYSRGNSPTRSACGQVVNGDRWEQTRIEWWAAVDADLPRCYACTLALERAAAAQDTQS